MSDTDFVIKKIVFFSGILFFKIKSIWDWHKITPILYNLESLHIKLATAVENWTINSRNSKDSESPTSKKISIVKVPGEAILDTEKCENPLPQTPDHTRGVCSTLQAHS